LQGQWKRVSGQYPPRPAYPPRNELQYNDTLFALQSQEFSAVAMGNALGFSEVFLAGQE